jgi:hypothetical protein
MPGGPLSPSEPLAVRSHVPPQRCESLAPRNSITVVASVYVQLPKYTCSTLFFWVLCGTLNSSNYFIVAAFRFN